MEIKIEKKNLLAAAPFVATAVLLAVFFIWQVKVSVVLNRELNSKKKEFKHAEAASKHLRQLERQISDMKQKGEQLYKIVPVNEKEPLGLMKMLIRLAGQAGLKNITLNVKEKAVSSEQDAQQGAQAEQEAGQAAVDGQGAEQPAPAVEEYPGQDVAAAQTVIVKPTYLEMEFEGGFTQALGFLEKLARLDRIVKVDRISVERKKEILPYQKVSLDLVAYTF